MTRSTLHVNRIIDQVCEKFGPLAGARVSPLVCRVSEQPYPLLVDVTLFQRVIENLVANALKFAPPQSTVTIQVEYPQLFACDPKSESQAAAPAPPQLRVSILDQGRGIPLGDMVRMFDQYEAVFMKEHGKSELGLELAFVAWWPRRTAGAFTPPTTPIAGAAITIEI